ncbi:MAG: TetR family transcriptional regulator, partial [Acidimicrobiales bacterium]
PVTSHARGRLLTAAAELLASRGYEALSEAAIVESAGLPSDSFDEHFVDIDDLCLVLLGAIGRARVRAVVGGVRGDAVAVPSLPMGGHLPFLDDAHVMEQLEAELRRLATRNEAARYGLSVVEARVAAANGRRTTRLVCA